MIYNKTILLLISAFAMIAFTGSAALHIADIDLGDGRPLAGSLLEPDNWTDIKDLDNIDLFIDDSRLLLNSHFSTLPNGGYAGGSSGPKTKAGNWVMDYRRDGNHEFVFKFNSLGPFTKSSHDFKASYTATMDVLSPGKKLRKNGLPAAQYTCINTIQPWPPLNVNGPPLSTIISHYSLYANPDGTLTSNPADYPVDSDLVISKSDLLNIEGPRAKVNLLWRLSYNDIEPFAKISSKFKHLEPK